MFENRRVYRKHHARTGLTPFEVTVKETNLNIQADQDLSALALRSILKYRQYIETHIAAHPQFASSLVPLPDPGFSPAPLPAIVQEMYEAARLAHVGPMASVAGAVAQFTGQDLLEQTREVIVENGGDIFVKSEKEMVFTIFAGDSPLSMKAGIRITPQTKPYAVCTSSGTFGHSKSFGRADAVCVFSPSALLADAAATGLCNQVQGPKDIEPVIARGRAIDGIQGLVIISGKSLGVWGNLELVKL